MAGRGFPGGITGEEPACQRRRHGFDPWVGKIPLEEGMATDSSTLAWRIPWTEEPGETIYRFAKTQTRLKQLGMHAVIGWHKRRT